MFDLRRLRFRPEPVREVAGRSCPTSSAPGVEERRSIRWRELQRIHQAFEGIRVRHPPDTALEIRNTSETDPGPLRKCLLGEPSAHAVASKQRPESWPIPIHVPSCSTEPYLRCVYFSTERVQDRVVSVRGLRVVASPVSRLLWPGHVETDHNHPESWKSVGVDWIRGECIATGVGVQRDHDHRIGRTSLTFSRTAHRGHRRG